jgi:predicted lysophospholipase L1 biosynthesis ABC-type transport system permease subunit
VRLLPEPVVVNEAFVARYFGNENPIDKRLCIDPTGKTYCMTIIGVVRDMRRQGLDRRTIPEIFATFLPSLNAELLVRTHGAPLAAAPAVRQLVRSVVPGAIVTSVTTVDRRMGTLTAQREFQTWLLVGFAALALALAAVGIYGVVHYAVAERTREIGVRIALGATPTDILTLVLRQGLRTPAVGIGVGIAAALLLTRVITHLVFEVTTTDPATLISVAAALIVVATAACWIPARRATRVDVTRALRQE